MSSTRCFGDYEIRSLIFPQHGVPYPWPCFFRQCPPASGCFESRIVKSVPPIPCSNSLFGIPYSGPAIPYSFSGIPYSFQVASILFRRCLMPYRVFSVVFGSSLFSTVDSPHFRNMTELHGYACISVCVPSRFPISMALCGLGDVR